MTGGHGHVIPRPDGVKARCGGPALCSVCAGELAQVRQGQTAAEALLALAAQLDRAAVSEAVHPDVQPGLRAAALLARQRAGTGGSEENEAAPVSREAQDAPEPSGRLSPAERDLVLADLGKLLEALGLGDYARPISPHEVMLQCITEVGRICAAERERIARLALEQASAIRRGSLHTIGAAALENFAGLIREAGHD